MASIEEQWRAEVSAGHRWGQEWSELFTEGLPRELEELDELWRAAAPLDAADAAVLEQVLALEICNWRLTEGILELTAAIGAHRPSPTGIGHRKSVTPERWAVVWAHDLALRQYLWSDQPADAFTPLLEVVDPDGAVRAKVADYLGERNEVKELLVQRLLYAMGWIVDHFPWGSTWHKAQNAGIEVIERRLQELGADPKIIERLRWHEVDGRLQPCSHKLVRRIDILVSSIGAEKWRGRIPMRGTDGLELSRVLDAHLEPIAAWLRDDGSALAEEEPGATILRDLGEPDPAKRFLARLLHSLLTSQQIEARIKGEERAAGGG